MHLTEEYIEVNRSTTSMKIQNLNELLNFKLIFSKRLRLKNCEKILTD